MTEEKTQEQVNSETPNIDRKLLDACIHCGLCLPACPTYVATGHETESPRGRIYLMNLWQEGKLPLSNRLGEHLESCLGCLGCQTACPSGVQYGSILDQARPYLPSLRPKAQDSFMRFIFAKVLPDYPLLKRLGALIRLWQETGSDKILRSIPGLKQLAHRLIEWQSFLPTVPKYVPLPSQSWASGKKEGQVQLFSGCVMDIFYNQVNHACLALLLAQKQIVSVPKQTCCGALAFHAGYEDIAKTQAKENIDLLDNSKGEIVVTAAGCGAMLKHYGELLSKDKDFAEKAKDFSERVVDITEFLSAHEFAVKAKPVKTKVAYHAACHLYHAQKISEPPLKLLEAIPELQVIPLTEAEHCCGSAGIFNLTHTELAEKILERKIDNIEQTGADLVVTTNPGCLLQIEHGLKEKNSKTKVLHLAELLIKAYKNED
jgi:glycolate oxidase iron-sulfur subunit